MRITLHQVIASVLVAAALTPAAQAQFRSQVFISPVVVPSTGTARVAIRTSGFGNVSVQTTVAVPDGGTATAGGYSRVSEGRSEYGVPIVGKAPYVGRGFRNVGYGRSTTSTRVNVRVRIIDLREEEYRQTGYRSP